jgi:serine/threonine-protein kinase RsbT
MTEAGSGESPLRSEHDIVLARQTVRRLTQELQFSLVDQTRNAYIYGRGGTMHWQIVEKENRQGLKLLFADEGPGIPNLDLAMTDGWTSGKGLGMGLTGTKRLVNEFDIDTKVNGGTRVTIVRWK